MPLQWNYDFCENKFLDRQRFKSVRYGFEYILFLAPQVWKILPDEVKGSETLQVFRAKIKYKYH